MPRRPPSATKPFRSRGVPTPSETVSIGLISLGCAKNLVDSQIMMGALLSAGLAPAPTPEAADVVLVNTCAFVHDAREESISAILSACRLKQAGPCRAVIVAGCLSQRYRADLKQSLPEVDAFVGLDELDRLPDIVRRVLDGERGVLQIGARASRIFEPSHPGLVLTGGPYAYLKIAEGCNHGCAFCAIPAIRGRRRSRTIASIVREAERLLENGYRELNLIAQDTTSYGMDRRDGTSLVRLLEALDRIDGTFWIRLLYGYPSRITADLLDTIASRPRICRYLDVPIQHTHPDMLRAMRRPVRPSLPALAQRIRNVLPDAVLRTTCLVGFPGETERHIDHLVDAVQTAAFDHLGVFAFSPEEHTPAERLRPRPSRRTAERRRERVLEAQAAVASRKTRALIGLSTEVLLARPQSPARWIARSRRQAPEVDGVTLVGNVSPKAQAGDFITVRYTGRRGVDLRAESLSPLT